MFEEHQEDPSEIVEHIRKYAHWKLQLRLLFYFIIASVILGIGTYHIIFGGISVVYPTISLCVGMILGVALSRMFHITWDNKAQMVISRMDALGLIILGVYLVLEINRDVLVHYFVNGSSTIAISFALLAGTMIGRIIGIRRKVKMVLQENL